MLHRYFSTETPLSSTMKAELYPAGSFIQNLPTNTASRRKSVGTASSHRAETRATSVGGKQVRCKGHDDEEMSHAGRRRSQRPSSAWKNRLRRPRFTDDFDVFDDPVVDLDIANLNVDDIVVEKDPTHSEHKDFSRTPRAWQDNNEIASGHQWSKPADVATSNYRGTSQQTTDDDCTSSEDTNTNRRDSGEPAPSFELTHIHAKVLEKYRTIATTTAATQSANRPKSKSCSTTVEPSEPIRATVDVDDGVGTVVHLRRQSMTPQRRLTPIDKRRKHRATKKRRVRRPESTEMTSQHGGQDGVLASGGGGGPKFRVTSGGRRGRLKPLISRRSRLALAEMTGAVPVPPAAKLDVKQSDTSSGTDSHPQILDRGTTFISATVADLSTEGCNNTPSTFQLHHLPLNLSASTSGSDMELSSPPTKSSETRVLHPHIAVPPLLLGSRKQNRTLMGKKSAVDMLAASDSNQSSPSNDEPKFQRASKDECTHSQPAVESRWLNSPDGSANDDAASRNRQTTLSSSYGLGLESGVARLCMNESLQYDEDVKLREPSLFAGVDGPAAGASRRRHHHQQQQKQHEERLSRIPRPVAAGSRHNSSVETHDDISTTPTSPQPITSPGFPLPSTSKHPSATSTVFTAPPELSQHTTITAQAIHISSTPHVTKNNTEKHLGPTTASAVSGKPSRSHKRSASNWETQQTLADLWTEFQKPTSFSTS